MKILIVDDDQETLNSIKNILHPTHYEIRTTTFTDEAIDLIKNEDFDALILDIKMQPVDGLTLLNEIRKLNQDLYVVIITAYEELPALEASDKFRIHAIFRKPVDARLLIKELREIKLLREYEKKIGIRR